ncbi:MAG: ABC transporter permease, partial [Odoribacter sp.]|nr:ABC transporter permease [Odoribacter sp.]
MRKFCNSIGQIFKNEVWEITTNVPVLIFFFGLTLAYPVLYTYIYNNETAREVPVAVVDSDDSAISREFIRSWDATPDVKVVAKCMNIEEAKRLLYKKEIYGILEIPFEFSHDIALGKQAYLSLFCDMGGLLNYKAILLSATDLSLLLGAQIQLQGLEYASPIQQQLTVSPIRIEEVKLYNPQSGYASFIIPAILILVIQQSLLLGVGTLAGTNREKNANKLLLTPCQLNATPVRIVLGKALAYLPIYLTVIVWIYVVVPGMFNLTQIGYRADIFIFLIPFILSCIFFAISLSFLCKEQASPYIIFVFTSVPLMFLSGISWPTQSTPEYWVLFSKIFPSTYGIEGYSRINNMGATLQEVNIQFNNLWILTGVYFI